MDFNYDELQGRIVQKYGTRYRFAAAMGMPASVLSSRLNNKTHFTMPEIYRAADLLGITLEEIGKYFFTLCVPLFGTNAVTAQ